MVAYNQIGGLTIENYMQKLILFNYQSINYFVLHQLTLFIGFSKKSKFYLRNDYIRLIQIVDLKLVFLIPWLSIGC